MTSKNEIAEALAIVAQQPNLRGRQSRAPPKVTTFECVHEWQLTPARNGILFCPKCRGYWHLVVGWMREPRRVKSLMKDDGVVRTQR